MSDIGKPVGVKRKFPIFTQFLDTELWSEDTVQDGETVETAIIRLHSELQATADRIKREAHPHLYQEERSAVSVQQVGYVPPPTTLTTTGTAPIDYKKLDELEIAIDNCMRVDELDQLKRDNPIFPAKLLNVFNQKRQELSK